MDCQALNVGVTDVWWMTLATMKGYCPSVSLACTDERWSVTGDGSTNSMIGY